jgi:hypothetical protein
VPAARYVPRLIDGPLKDLVSGLPAVMVLGPRACGKTTSAARLAAEVVRLDDPKVAELYRADPDGALAGRPAPLLLDEWQEVPEVLGAIKRAVDEDFRPGRFIRPAACGPGGVAAGGQPPGAWSPPGWAASPSASSRARWPARASLSGPSAPTIP